MSRRTRRAAHVRPNTPTPPSPPPAAKSRRGIALVLLIGLLCTAWIGWVRWRLADEPFETDICTEILQGRILADGGKMYVDTVEMKPPGTFVIWQMVHMLVGTSPTVVAWVNALVAVLTMVGVYWAGSARPWGREGGLWAMGFWTVICGDIMLQANQPNNEVFMNVLTVWGLALWVRADADTSRWYRYAAAGLLLAGATLVKQAVLATVGCMALAWVFSAGFHTAAIVRRSMSALCVLASIAGAWATMLLYFAAQGRLGKFYDYVVRYASFYAAESGKGGLWMNLVEGMRPHTLLPPTMYFLAPLLLLTAIACAYAWRRGPCPQAMLLAASLPGTFVVVSTPGWFYAHYYQLYLPIMAVGAGWGVVASGAVLRRRLLSLCLGALSLVILLLHVIPYYQFNGEVCCVCKARTDGDIEIQRSGRVIDDLLKEDETLYAWGTHPGIYYYSDHRPASGILWADRSVRGPGHHECAEKILADIERTQPALVLVEHNGTGDATMEASHPVAQWIKTHCTLAPALAFSQRFQVYILNDSALASRLKARPRSIGPVVSKKDTVGWLRDVLKIAPHDVRIHNNLGTALAEQGEFNEAIDHFQEVLKIDPNHASAHINMGQVLAEKGDFEKAIPHYRNALTINPRLPLAHMNWGLALAHGGKLDEAIDHYRAALDIRSDLAMAHDNWGLALLDQHKPQAAAEHFREAMEIEPAFADAYGHLGDALTGTGRSEQAVDQYRKALDINGGLEWVRLRLGGVLAGQKRFAEATAEWQAVLRINPRNADAHFNLGKVCLLNRQFDDAVRHFEATLKISPNYPGASATLAEARARRNQHNAPLQGAAP